MYTHHLKKLILFKINFIFQNNFEIYPVYPVLHKQLVLEPITSQNPFIEHGLIGVTIGELDGNLHVYEFVQSKDTIVSPTGITVLLSSIVQPQLV